jgi:deazaflavin-dependent oxidoreductase (nitroreductase family)
VPAADRPQDERRPEDERSLEEDLTAWGKVLTIETRGRKTGRPRRAVVGFVAAADGTFLVAASDPSTAWVGNLIVEPTCAIELAGVRSDCRASQLGGPEAHSAVAALILKYGTPAERLGAGPAFRLTPLPAGG